MILKNGKRIDGCTDTLPVGTVQPFLGLTPPTGYLLCQGQLVSKTTYPKLYEICGNLFGEETETEFRLPDLRGKTIIGFDEGDTLLSVMGEILGSKTHTHTTAEHTHTIAGHTHTSAAHTHSVAGHTHTSAAHTHTTGNHTLTVAEIPAHSHAVYGGANVQSSGGSEGLESFGSRYSSFRAIEQGTYNTGGGGAHNHGNTGSTTPGNTGSTSLTTNSTTPDNTGSTSLTTNSSAAGDTGIADNYQPSIVMNWIVKAVMLIPEYFIVENTLGSDSASNALSAAQGKILNDKIENHASLFNNYLLKDDYTTGEYKEIEFTDVTTGWGTPLAKITLSKGVWVIVAHAQYKGMNARWYLSIGGFSIGATDSLGYVAGTVTNIVIPTKDTEYTLQAYLSNPTEQQVIENATMSGFIKAIKIR